LVLFFKKEPVPSLSRFRQRLCGACVIASVTLLCGQAAFRRFAQPVS
jgi:hypothetical protein